MGLKKTLFGFCAVLLLAGITFRTGATLMADGPEPRPIPYSLIAA